MEPTAARTDARPSYAPPGAADRLDDRPAAATTLHRAAQVAGSLKALAGLLVVLVAAVAVILTGLSIPSRVAALERDSGTMRSAFLDFADKQEAFWRLQCMQTRPELQSAAGVPCAPLLAGQHVTALPYRRDARP